MKSKKVIASVLMATICLAGIAACGNETIATSPNETAVTETDAAGNVINPDLYPAITDESDLANVLGETETSVEDSNVLPYFISDFGTINCEVNPIGAEMLVATSDSDFGVYSCEFANYDHGDTIQIVVTIDDDTYDELNYSVVFAEAQADWDADEIVNAVALKEDNGTYIISFEDVEEENGVYTINIFTPAGQGWISVSVGYTQDTVSDYFAPFYGDDIEDSIVELPAADDAEVEASETVADE